MDEMTQQTYYKLVDEFRSRREGYLVRAHESERHREFTDAAIWRGKADSMNVAISVLGDYA